MSCSSRLVDVSSSKSRSQICSKPSVNGAASVSGGDGTPVVSQPPANCAALAKTRVKMQPSVASAKSVSNPSSRSMGSHPIKSTGNAASMQTALQTTPPSSSVVSQPGAARSAGSAKAVPVNQAAVSAQVRGKQSLHSSMHSAIPKPTSGHPAKPPIITGSQSRSNNSNAHITPANTQTASRTPQQQCRETAVQVAIQQKAQSVRALNRIAPRQSANVLMKQTVLQNQHHSSPNQSAADPSCVPVVRSLAKCKAQQPAQNKSAMKPAYYYAANSGRSSAALESNRVTPTSHLTQRQAGHPVAQLPNGYAAQIEKDRERFGAQCQPPHPMTSHLTQHQAGHPVAQRPSGYAAQIAKDRERFGAQCQPPHPMTVAPVQSIAAFAQYPSHYPYLYVPMANNVPQQRTLAPSIPSLQHPSGNYVGGQTAVPSRSKQMQSQTLTAQAYRQNLQGAQNRNAHQQTVVPTAPVIPQQGVLQTSMTHTRPIVDARRIPEQSRATSHVQQTPYAPHVARAQLFAHTPQTQTQVRPSIAASNPTLNPVGMQQPVKQFSRSRVAPRPKEPTLMHYYNRLDKIIQEATEFSRTLRVPADFAHPDKGQMPRVVAYEFQGVLGSEIDGLLKKRASDSAFVTTFTSKVAGDFVEYGVSGSNLAHIADALLAKPAASSYVLEPAVSPQQSHTHPIVERARVRVFEAEITHLPLSFVETLVKIRRTMRRFKSRIDLHVRIILALEGKGRKVSDAQLDRLKLQLEKADQQAETERKRRMAAEAARLEKERRVKEAAKQSERSGVKDKELKKRRRQENAQASFMKRFVRPKTDERPAEELQEVQYTPRERTGHYALDVATDPNVMGVEWWLRSELRFVPVSKLDELFKEMPDGLRDHLMMCAERRKGAERNLNTVLQDYRSQRRMLADDRYPQFVRRRAEVRGRRQQGPIKLLQFDENHRPAYFGSFRKSTHVSGRRPFKKDNSINYDHDSEAEWEEEEEGEDILDVEAEKELASEEAELKKLYGSDDEDDDDFLDDDDMADDDDDGEDGEGNQSQGTDGEKKAAIEMDLTQGQQNEVKKPRDGMKVKRKKSAFCTVVIEGISLSGPSKLDAYPVTAFANSKPIPMFNPFVFSASDIAAEHLKSKVPPTRAVKLSNIDEKAKLDLAVALVNDGSNRDRIVYQFCESRRTRGLIVPAKSEVVRAISQMATREKRDGDSRAVWYLNDAHLERMVQQMGHIGQATDSSRPIAATLSSGK